MRDPGSGMRDERFERPLVPEVAVGAERRRLTGPHVDVEADRLVAAPEHLDVMRARFQVDVLEDAVEVVDDAHVVAVGEHLRVTWRARYADAAIRASGDGLVVAARRVAVRVVAAGAVEHAEAVARAIHVRTVRHDADDLRTDDARRNVACRIRMRVVGPDVVVPVRVVVVVPVVAAVVVAAGSVVVAVAAVVVAPVIVVAAVLLGAALVVRAWLRLLLPRPLLLPLRLLLALRLCLRLRRLLPLRLGPLGTL